MDLQKTGKFISEMRKKKNLTQSQLGEMLGISGKAVSKWERGINAPDISVLSELSNILDVSVSEILKGEKIDANLSNTANEITVSSIDAYSQIFKKKYTKVIFILVAILLLLTLIFSATYLITNYNKCFVYQLSSGRDDFYLEGLIANNQKENSVIITGMHYSDPKTRTEEDSYIDNVEVIVVINNTVISNQKFYFDNVNLTLTQALHSVYIKLEENSKLTSDVFNKRNLSNMHMKIKWEDENGLDGELEVPVEIQKRFSNNQIIY